MAFETPILNLPVAISYCGCPQIIDFVSASDVLYQGRLVGSYPSGTFPPSARFALNVFLSFVPIYTSKISG